MVWFSIFADVRHITWGPAVNYYVVLWEKPSIKFSFSLEKHNHYIVQMDNLNMVDDNILFNVPSIS